MNITQTNDQKRVTLSNFSSTAYLHVDIVLYI